MEFDQKSNLGTEYVWNLDGLKQILKYYKDYHPESKKNDIAIIEEIIKTQKGDYDLYLVDFDIAIEMNKRTPIIKYILDFCNDSYVQSINTLKDFVKSWEEIEYLINQKLISFINESYMDILIKYFNDEKNKEILLKIFRKEIYEFFKDNKATNNICLFPNYSYINMHVNERGNEPYIIYDEICYGICNTKITFDKIKENKDLYPDYGRFYNFLKVIEKNIKEYFLYNYNLRIKLEFIKAHPSHTSNINYIKCIYTFYEPINNKPIRFKDEDILSNGINTQSQGFYYLLNEINNENYKNKEYIKFNSNQNKE